QVNSINQTLKKYIISNTPYKAYLKLVKKDATTGKAVTLSNATFKIFDIAKNKYVTQKVGNKTMSEFTTDETGATVLPLKLKNGDYRLEEIKAPNQYLISSTSIPFKITSSNVHEIDKDGDKIQSVEFANTPVLGTIEVTKTGEVLTGSKIDKDGNIDFVYETRNIPGMQVEILAKDDILDAADGSILFKKGSVVETMTTGVDGKIISSQIPLGNYIVKEVKAPNGFTLDTKEYDVSLKYKDDVTPIIEKSLTINDQRQKINAMILKQDFDTKTGLSGAKFGLYATEDIRGEDGSVLVTKDTLIETQISNEKGEVKFKADFPLTTYSIKEIAQPIGYATSNETLLLDGTYKDQTKETISYNEIFKNKITKLEVSKVDITTGKELPGNQLKVYEKENKGNVFDTWISDKTPHLIKGLEVGKTYVLKETSSAYGFALSKDVEFTIKDTGEIQKVKMENKLVEGKLSFTKTGNTFLNVKDNETEFGKMQSPVWNKENLIGSEIAIYAQEDIILGNDVTYFKKDEKVTTLASDLEPVTSESLPVGKYYYIETKAPAGYVKDNEKHLFEIKDNQKDELQIVSSSLNNERPNYELMFQKDLEANDIENKNAYKDVIFGLYAKKDILNAKGEIGITADTMIANLNIDEKGNLINFPILPVGTYYLKELQTNEAYILDEKEYDFTIQLSDEKDVPVMVNENKPIKNMLKDFKLVIQKLDSETKKNILNSDFEFSRYEDSKATKLIDTATTNKENGTATFDDLHYGITYIKESKAPVGYQLSKEIMKVEVKGDKVYINDKECTKVKEIDSVDYLNTLLPKINTGDNSTPVIFTFFGSISSIVLCSAFALKKRKEKIQAKAIKDLFESTKF
ncbi:MAG: SpaA isopeptide-forming pilin-related protein, partial [Erysipelotrichaceae bacterium]